MIIALSQRGIISLLSSVRRAMRKGNLLKPNRRFPDGLTRADKKSILPQNLLNRTFTAKVPNGKWLTDISQVQCSDGKLYIVPVFECFGGEIVSLAMDTNMKKELYISAVEAAFKLRNPSSGVLVHSDTGSQYTSDAYKLMIGKHHAVQSMSDVGKCYDNARMESFLQR